MLRSLLLGFSLIIALDVSAQPELAVSPETLFYPTETTFTATNVGAGSLTLSFPFTNDVFYGTVVGYGWGFEVETPDSLYLVYLPHEIEPFPVIPLAAGESASFGITLFDPCPVCATEGGSDFVADTLYLRSADTSGSDTTRVVLDLGEYVSSEPSAPSAPFVRVTAYPNPVRRVLTIVIEPDRGSPPGVALRIVDALGREVRRFEGVAATGQALRLDVGELPAGAYVLQVESVLDTEGFETIARPFVVVR